METNNEKTDVKSTKWKDKEFRSSIFQQPTLANSLAHSTTSTLLRSTLLRTQTRKMGVKSPYLDTPMSTFSCLGATLSPLTNKSPMLTVKPRTGVAGITKMPPLPTFNRDTPTKTINSRARHWVQMRHKNAVLPGNFFHINFVNLVHYNSSRILFNILLQISV